MTKISERLGALGMSARPHTAEELETFRPFWSCFENRVTVGPLYMAFPPEADRRKTKFSSEDNLEIPESGLLEFDEESVFSLISGPMVNMFLRAISYASIPFDDDMDRLEHCLRIDVYASSRAGFENVGILELMMRNNVEKYMGEEQHPVINPVAVTSLPRSCLFGAVFEFGGK